MTDLSLSASGTALLSLHFQNDIIGPSALASEAEATRAAFAKAIATTERLLAAARAARVPVVHVRIAFAPGYPEIGARPTPMQTYMKKHGVLVEGDPGAAVHENLRPLAGEMVVTNQAVSAFAGSGLASHLASHGVHTVLLAGLVTHYVVEGTARDAADRGYRFVAVVDACASGTAERHEAALRNLSFLGTIAESAEVMAALR